MFRNFLIFIFFLPIGVAALFFYNLWFLKESGQPMVLSLPKTKFSIKKAPTDSLVGRISSFSGRVGWQSRSAQSATPINSPTDLLQGEEVDTQDNANATVEFPGVGQFLLLSNTKVDIIQTLPANFVLEQKQGIVNYRKTGNKIPVSIRGLDLLININSGEGKVSVDKKNAGISISVVAGSVTIAFNNTNNQSRVLNVEKGQKLIFNNNTKTYRFL